MQATIPSRVLTGVVLPRSTSITIALVVGFALVTAASAQLAIPLPFTEVPLSGQTFGMILAGAALGSTAGAASQLLYLMLGAVGLPFYAGGTSGWEVVRGATGGYIVGFIVGAWVIGRLAERKRDRKVKTAIPAILFGSAMVYAIGVPWLAVVTGRSLPEAISAGMAPFIVGDLLKVVAAGLLLPATWRLVGRIRKI